MKDDNGSSRLRRGGKADGPLALMLAIGITLTTAMALALVSVETTSAQPATCGNGTLDLGEDCDLSSPSGSFCNPPAVCNSSCECAFVGTTTTTSSTTVIVPTTTIATPTTTVVTPTTTSTTLLNHYQCYEIKRRGPGQTASGVTVQDQFGTTGPLTLTKPNRICAPTNKQNEDPGSQNDPAHLKAWQDKHNRAKSLNHEVVNQFGTLRLDVSRPQFLLVPAAKSTTTTPPPPLAGPTPDHFQCYKVSRSRGGPKFTKIAGVTAQDQFGVYTVDLIKPKYLCAPANKNGEDPTAPAHPEHLLCYKTRKQGSFGEQDVTVTDQFGSAAHEIIHRIELCVPSLKDPSAPTTTTTSTTTTSTAVTPTTVVTTSTVVTTTVVTTTVVTTTVTTSSTTTVTTSTTTSSTTTTTLYGSPSRAFVEPVRSLLD